MRIIQPCGPSHRDDGGPFYIKKYLNRIPGVTCDRIPVTVPEPEWGEYDGVIYVDWGQDAFPHLPFPKIHPGKPSLCWLSDTHMNQETKRIRYEWAKHFRVPVFYMKDAAEGFEGSHWIPTAADHEIYMPPRWTNPIYNRYDLCFVGHTGDPRRDAMLDVMFRAVPRFGFRTGVFFEDANRVFNQSHISFNCSLREDLNTRTFEVLASGSFLLTDRQLGMEQLGLRDGVHCAIYDTPNEAVEKARYWLAHEIERDAVRSAGRAWCLKQHTFDHRARRLLSLLEYP